MRASFLTLSLIAASAFAETLVPIDCRPIPGERMPSGEMIVRPMQLDQAMGDGMLSPLEIAGIDNARKAVQSYVIRHIPETDEYIIRIPSNADANVFAQTLASKGSFHYITPNWIVYPVVIPNDPRWTSMWHMTKVAAPAGWDLYRGENSNIVVCVTDTGARLTHEDLVDRLVPGGNSASGTAVAQNGTGSNVNDLNGHGTHVAGTVGATGNNAKGVVGMGWGLKIMPVRVSDSTGGGSSIAALTAGARFGADNGARVVSTSYSGISNAAFQTTGQYLRTKNCLYCFAAGNSNSNLTFDHLDVTIVGATTETDAKASFSSYGLAIDVVAPGTNILSSTFTSNTSYGLNSGTSMATPGVAGLAGLVTSSNTSLTSYQVEEALYQATDDLGTAGNDNTFGWGRININKALRYAYNNFPILPASVATTLGSSLGDPQSNANSSDNTYYRAQGPSVTIRVKYPTTLLQMGTMSFRWEDSVLATGQAFVQVKTASGVTGQVLHSGTASGTDTVRNVNVPVNAMDNGTKEVWLDITYTKISPSPTNMLVRLDQAVLFTRPNP